MLRTSDATTEADEASQLVREALAVGLRPDPQLSIAQWADRFRLLTAPSRERGPYRTDRTPYLREVMEALSPRSPVQSVVVMKGAQLGFTQLGLNWIGYSIHASPAGLIYVGSSLKKATEVGKVHVNSMIRGTPELAQRVAMNRRDETNTANLKVYPGGMLLILGANNPDELRSSTAGRMIFDELDAYEVDIGAGDPLDLGRRAMRTFGRSKKELLISTPAHKETSKILPEFEKGDQRYYFCPCPECEVPFRFLWELVKYENDDPSTARMACPSCGVLIEETAKAQMLAAGEWRATYPERSGTRRSYHLSALYSPPGMRSWAEIVAAHLEAKDNPAKRRVWINEDLGLAWEPKVKRPEWQSLLDRREDYTRGTVPLGGLVLTAGADVQEDRIEVEVVAWGPRAESWSIEFAVLSGDTSQAEVWDDLDVLLATEWLTAAGGRLRITRIAVDAGFRPNSVYNWTRRHPQSQTMAVRGRVLPGTTIGKPTDVDVDAGGRRIRRGAQVWQVGVDTLKEELYGWLPKGPPEGPDTRRPYGLCHFPQYPESYFRQLCSHRLVVREQQRKRVWVWEKMAFERDEALDCRIYARAAALAVGIDRWPDEHWEKLAEVAGRAPMSTAGAAPKRRKKKSEPSESIYARWRQ